MESNGIEWNGMEWNGMEWNGMEWNIISVIFSIVYNGKRRLRKGFTHN